MRGVEGSDIACFEFNRRMGIVGVSLFTDEGESWRWHRVIINPVLAKRHLATGLAAAFRRRTRRFDLSAY